MLRTLLKNLIFTVTRGLLFLRYRVKVSGLEALVPERFTRSGGVLFLPNHPAQIDPVILMALLQKFSPRPLVLEQFYYLKGIQFFMRLVQALPLPSLDRVHSRWREKKIQKQFQNVVGELKRGENFLIYPSGRLKLTGLEMVGGASFVHDLLQACPETNVVLVRTTGLWGSQFSRAITGVSPDLGKTAWGCLKILVKNGIFFAPRREVVVELELAPADFPYGASRLELNKYLERWYNRWGAEPLKLVSFAFWKEKLPQVALTDNVSSLQKIELKPVSQKVQQKVFQELSHLSKRSSEQIDRRMHLSHDLGLDSLDVVQLYVFLAEQFEVHDLVPRDLQSVEDVMQAAAGVHREKEEQNPSQGAPFAWPEEPHRPPPALAQGRTLQEAFLLACERMQGSVACVDSLSGLLTYRRMKMAVLVLAEKMRELSGKQVGVMLPAASGTYLVILALLMAGKVPVMVNWKAGVKALEHAVEVTGVQVVISSDRFLDHLENGELGRVEGMLLLMEEIRKKISWKDKLKGWGASRLSASSLLRLGHLEKIQEEETAVILFTSGTEALPKAVPLSHGNLLSNQRAAVEAARVKVGEIFYGVLPPFHSFGFSVTGLLPLLSGIRACYAPDPTDSHGMAHDLRTWQPTLFCCAPSFFRALFQVAKPEGLQSLRYVVTGAEKAPEPFFQYVAEKLPQAQALEGYGITECSPIVTLTYPGEPRKGVGRALPGVSLCIIDGAAHVLPPGEEGEVCIRGPGVFQGYLGSSRDPFVQIAGERWYASGDRGFLDREGNLTLSGRLKRFVKIGGEMISLGGLEEELLKIAHDKGWELPSSEGPPLAVSVRERESEKPLIVLYSLLPLSLEEVNQALKISGYARLVKISEVKQIAQIPLTGTGKTDYRLLDEMAS